MRYLDSVSGPAGPVLHNQTMSLTILGIQSFQPSPPQPFCQNGFAESRVARVLFPALR